MRAPCLSSLLGIMLCCVVSPRLLADTKPTPTAEDAFRVVRAYADAMLEHGRDRYGEVHSPLFAAGLDRRSFTVFDKSPPNLRDIRSGDRTYNGANPMHDENLLQILYVLADLTGEPHYAQQADAAIAWFFQHCQSPKGLMAWGEHQGWDFFKDAPSAPEGPHEFYRPWVFWDRSYTLAPEACHRFALGLWQHQIGDQRKGLFSRHAMSIWDEDKKSSRTGYEFPRHGGFYIATWAADYQRTQDPVMLQAIQSLLDGFLGRRHPTTGAIPAQTSLPELMWPQSNLSLAIDLWNSAAQVPNPLADRMRDAARQIDLVFLKIKHEPGPGGKGFVKACHTSDLTPGDARAEQAGSTKPAPQTSPSQAGRQAQAGVPSGSAANSKGLRWRPYTETWATGYGVSVHAQIAMLCLTRYRQTPVEAYRKLFLATADTYLQAEPTLNPSKNEQGKTITPILYPGAIGEVLALETAAYRLTGEAKYLVRAEHFARLAMNLFFPPDSPLPRVASAANLNWYECITRADTLALALLDFWAAQARPDITLAVQWVDR